MGSKMLSKDLTPIFCLLVGSGTHNLEIYGFPGTHANVATAITHQFWNFAVFHVGSKGKRAEISKLVEEEAVPSHKPRKSYRGFYSNIIICGLTLSHEKHIKNAF